MPGKSFDWLQKNLGPTLEGKERERLTQRLIMDGGCPA